MKTVRFTKCKMFYDGPHGNQTGTYVRAEVAEALLEACEAVRDYMVTFGGQEVWNRVAAEKLNAAIAKAKEKPNDRS